MEFQLIKFNKIVTIVVPSISKMRLTIEIMDFKVFNLLKELEKLRLLRLVEQTTNGTIPDQKPILKKEFKAIHLDTIGFKFNREEANER